MEEAVAEVTVMEARAELVVEADMKPLNSMMTECNVHIVVVNLLSLPVKDICLTVSSL